MKKWISLIAYALIVSFSTAQNHDSQPIRFIFETIHDHLGNKEINSKRVQLFDTEHRLLYEADLYEGNELDEQFFYYDGEGKLLRDHRIFHQKHESGDYRMKYDDKGNLIEETNVNDIDEVLERISRTYNGKGQMITEKKEFLHHNEGKMIQETSFEFTYDEKGQLLTKKGWEDGHSNILVTYKYAYSPNSESISKLNSTGVTVEKWEQKKDEKGRLLQDVHTVSRPGQRSITKTIDFTYDEYDHILTETLSKSGSQVKMQILFDYKYDDHGNWIERKEKKVKGVKTTPGNHLIRHIEYYDRENYEHPPMELDETFNWEMHDGKELKIFQESHVRILNNDGKIEWVVRRNGPDLFQIDEYEYHKDGKLDRIFHLTHEKEDKAYTIATHNDNELMTELTTYSHNGKVDEKIMLEYDGSGKLVKKAEAFAGPQHGPLKTEITEEFKYDGDNVTKVSLTEYGSEFEVLYEYDGSGNVIREIQNPKSKDDEMLTIEYTYADGKLVSEIELEGKGKKESDKITYEYDSGGELIKSAHYRKGKIHSEVDYVYFE